MAIGKRLKELLKEKKITVKQLANLSGVSENTLYAIIKRDNKKLNHDIANRIARSLDVDVYMLLGIETDNALNTITEKEPLMPGEIIIDITIENFKKYNKIFLLAFDKIIDEIYKSYDVEVKFYNADTGEEISLKNHDFKELSDEDRLIFFQKTVKEIRYNTILYTFSISIL